MLTEEKRSIEEQYTSAMTSSDLRVEADRRSDADVIIAAGWNQSRIGGALLRLHAEWDASEKPRMANYEQFLPMTAGTGKERRAAAHKLAHKHNLHEMGLLLQKLKALPAVREQVTIQLLKGGIEDAEVKAAEVIRWWLAQKCPTCNGTKYQVAQGTNRQTGKACETCRGTGEREIPHEQVGRKCASWMDQCVGRARADMGRRLRPFDPEVVDKGIQKA